MRNLYLLAFFLLLMTLLAWWWSPSPKFGERIPLTLTSDASSARVAQVEHYNQLYPQYYLRLDPDNGGLTKTLIQCSAGIGADLIDHVGEYNFSTYHRAGILWDITDFAAARGFGTATLPANVRALVQMPTIDEAGQIRERQYIYPAEVFYNILFYNKNIFDRYGVPYPPEFPTWEEYIALAKKLTIYENGALKICGSAEMSIEVLLWGYGGDFFNDDGTQCTLDSDGAIAAFTEYHRLIHREKIEPSAVATAGLTARGGANYGFVNLFAEGKVAMYWGTCWMLAPFRQYQREQRAAYTAWEQNNKSGAPPEILRFGIVNVPHFPDRPVFTRLGVRGTGINAQSPKRTAALTFLEFLARADYAAINNTLAENAAVVVDADEAEMHRRAAAAVQFGRSPRRSLFVSGLFVTRAVEAMRSKLAAVENLPPEIIAAEMRRLTAQINAEIARNLERDVRLRRAYEKK